MPKQTHSKKKSTTYTRNRAATARSPRQLIAETDGTYFLKLVVFVLLGTLWLKFDEPLIWGSFVVTALPLGLFIGLPLIRQFEKMQSDRKIWYAVLLVVTIICYFAPAGIVI